MKYTDKQKHEIATHSAEQFIEMYGKALSSEDQAKLKQEIFEIEIRCLEDEEQILPELGVYSQAADEEMLKRFNQSGYEAYQAALKYGIDTGFAKIMQRLTM